MSILINNLKRILIDKKNIFFMIVLPLILVSITMIIATYSEEKITVGVVDYDNTKFTSILVDNLNNKANIKYVKEDEIKSLLFKNKVEYAIIIPKGTTESLIKGKEIIIKSFSIKETNISLPVKFYLNNFLNSANNLAKDSDGNYEKFYAKLDNYLKGNLQIKYVSTEKNKDRKNNTLASLGLFIMSMLYLSQSSTELILEDKNLKILSRILSAPVKPFYYSLQNILSFFIVLIFQLMIIFSVMLLIFKADFGPSPLNVYFLFLIFSIMCVSLGTAVAAFAKNRLQASALSPLITVPICMLGGCFWPKDIMPSFMQKISKFVPTSWIMDASEKLILGGSLKDVLSNIFVILLFTIVFLLLSSWRKKELLE
ncbi:ABC transporter permease [Caloramator sp. CAR-1]|uniref:ABC transporter permease n=1 Tax=Caloramator sp. CAR-1 TaxID=3062777 RepID=UPI0026E2A814|nr:ABC transporter permease [Caloramator sp. CAR-1]MDO6355511.1 ABC transporter permease [Caloramator sp. CAR-1]